MRRILLGVIAGSMLLVGCGPADQPVPPAMGPPEVAVARPEQQTITEWDEYTGRFEARKSVEIRARVTGYLQEVGFQDGQIVSKGDLLFVIDRRPFQYALQRAEAQHELAKKDYARAQTLLRSRSIPQEEFDRRFQEVRVTEASLLQAQLEMEFTEVRSPIDGRASRDLNNVGNLVSANETVLTTIVSIEPMHFYFDASQADLLKYIRMDRAGERPGSQDNPNVVELQLPDETGFPHPGVMDFVDNRVDASTGTIVGRALVDNPGGVIYPGMFGRARLIGRSNLDVLALPRSAINTDQTRRFVYIVDSQNLAQRVYVIPGRMLEGDMQVIESGLDGSENVVVSGLQRIRMPSQPVTPVPASGNP